MLATQKISVDELEASKPNSDSLMTIYSKYHFLRDNSVIFHLKKPDNSILQTLIYKREDSVRRYLFNNGIADKEAQVYLKLYHDLYQRVEEEENDVLIKALEEVKEEAVEEDAGGEENEAEDAGGEDVEEEAGGENGAIDDEIQTPGAGESNILFSPSPLLNIEDSDPGQSPSLHYPEDYTLDPEWMMMMVNEDDAGYDEDIST